MSGFSRTFKYVTEFDGDEIEFTLTRLKRKEVIQLTPLFSKVSKNITEDEALTIANTFMDVVKPNIVDMKGLKDEDGNAVSVEEMIEEQYFFNLSSQVVNVLMEKSNPVKATETEKKSEASLPTISTHTSSEKI